MATYRYDQSNDVLTKYDPLTKSYIAADTAQLPAIRHHDPILPPEAYAIETPHRIAASAQQNRMQASDNHAPLDHAQASLYYSSSYIIAAAVITIGLILLAWLAGVASFPVLFYGGLVCWGLAVLWILHRNRMLGLRHSATGIAHHDIDARVELGKYAIDKHVELMKARYGVSE